MIKLTLLSNVFRIQKYMEQKEKTTVCEIRDQLHIQSQEVSLGVNWISYENRIYLNQHDQKLFVIILNH